MVNEYRHDYGCRKGWDERVEVALLRGGASMRSTPGSMGQRLLFDSWGLTGVRGSEGSRPR